MARRRGVIERGFILYRGTRAFIISRATDALPLAAFLMGAGEWLRRQPGAQALNEVRRRTNQRGVDFTRRAVLGACRMKHAGWAPLCAALTLRLAAKSDRRLLRIAHTGLW